MKKDKSAESKAPDARQKSKDGPVEKIRPNRNLRPAKQADAKPGKDIIDDTNAG